MPADRLTDAAPEMLRTLRFVLKWIRMRESKGETLPEQLVDSVSRAIASACSNCSGTGEWESELCEGLSTCPCQHPEEYA